MFLPPCKHEERGYHRGEINYTLLTDDADEEQCCEWAVPHKVVE